MSIKYIVTGSAGFIGSNLVRELNVRGEKDILIVDALGTGEKRKNLVGLIYEDDIDKSGPSSWLDGISLEQGVADYVCNYLLPSLAK